MRERIKNHIGRCFLIVTTEKHIINTKKRKAVVTKVTKKAIFRPVYLTPSERAKEKHFRELLKLKEFNRQQFFKD